MSRLATSRESPWSRAFDPSGYGIRARVASPGPRRSSPGGLLEVHYLDVAPCVSELPLGLSGSWSGSRSWRSTTGPARTISSSMPHSRHSPAIRPARHRCAGISAGSSLVRPRATCGSPVRASASSGSKRASDGFGRSSKDTADLKAKPDGPAGCAITAAGDSASLGACG